MLAQTWLVTFIRAMTNLTQDRYWLNKLRILSVFHQNICGLLKKREELLNSLTSNSPQIICITEHHLADEKLEGVKLHQYILGAKFCRWMHKCGGVCIFIQDNIHYTNINMDKYSNEKDIKFVQWNYIFHLIPML